MLYSQKVAAELEQKRAALSGYQDRYRRHLDTYRDALAALGARYASAHALTAAQDARRTHAEAAPSVGARPTVEYDTWRQLSSQGMPVLPFGQSFTHHGEARAWAERIRDVTTFAVDGSQLPPWRDASIPVALVQVALYENPHQPPAPYIKDAITELLTPDDLLVSEREASDARAGAALTYSTQVVHLRRFELEVRTLVERMEHHTRQRREDAAPGSVVAFYDGSLIVSFALALSPPYRTRYVDAARRLLRASTECRIPLVAYIDTSYARDIVTMLRGLDEPEALPEARGVHDALLWRGALRWGDRTPAFLSARDDMHSMNYGEQADQIAFVYFQAAQDRPPARLEFPRWLLDAGLLDGVMDVVRAETIAGTGYPYPIEAADAAAVISTHEREQFYRLFQDFAEQEGLAFSFSRKALSKSRRRV